MNTAAPRTCTVVLTEDELEILDHVLVRYRISRAGTPEQQSRARDLELRLDRTPLDSQEARPW